MLDSLLLSALIFLLLLGWILVQQVSRLSAQRHPQFGPAKEEGNECAKNCLGKGGANVSTIN